jgi:RNA polymerase sigma factor (sigma-70 family)
MSDEELVDYINDARAAGQHEDALLALKILVFGYSDRILAYVRNRAPYEESEQIAGQVLVSAIESAVNYEGKRIESFGAWIYLIARRRIADFLRKRRLELRPLPEEHEENDDIFGELSEVQDETGMVQVQSAVDDCLDRLSEPHRRVVVLAIFEDRSAREVCAIVNEEFPDLPKPMSESNVDQIKSRFRKCLRGELEDD